MQVLRPGAQDGMNDEDRAVVLTIIETCARPSEICNLAEQVIKLDAVPHVLIEPRLDPDDPREIKSTTSARAVPLVGLALAVMTKFPKGFPRYKDKESSMSAAHREARSAAGTPWCRCRCRADRIGHLARVHPSRDEAP